MKLFDPRHRKVTSEQANRYARFEIFHTIADFSAATFFLVGSILFFFTATETVAIVCFVIGSVLFMAKPSIRLGREIWLAQAHDVDQLAKLAPEGPGKIQEIHQATDYPSVTGDDKSAQPSRDNTADSRHDEHRS